MEEYIYNAIREFLDECGDDDLTQYANECNSYDGSMDDFVWYSMDDFDDIVNGSPMEIAQMIFYGDFNPNHSYFRFDGYANLESTDYIDFDESDKDELMEAFENIPYMYLPSDIQEVYDNAEMEMEMMEDEEEDEEEEDEEDEE